MVGARLTPVADTLPTHKPEGSSDAASGVSQYTPTW